MTILSIPFVLVLCFFQGLAKGMMPFWVIWANTWRMMARPMLSLISEVFWSFKYNYSVFHYQRKWDGAPMPGETFPVFSPPTAGPPPHKSYESVV